MAGPGEPKTPASPMPDHDDDHVGFASPAALRGQPRPATATVEAPVPFASPERGARCRRDVEDRGSLSLYTGYALILLGVPTAGVALLVGLLFSRGRPTPIDALQASHARYQDRTLLAAIGVGVAGLILLAAPLALGVPVLFALALWTIARGATGLWSLRAGRPVQRPDHWWI